MIAQKKLTPLTVILGVGCGMILAAVICLVLFSSQGCSQTASKPTPRGSRIETPPPAKEPAKSPPRNQTITPPPVYTPTIKREFVVDADPAFSVCDAATHGVPVTDECLAKRSNLFVWHGDQLWSAQDCATDPAGKSCQFFATRATASVPLILDLFSRAPCSARARQAGDVNASGCLDLFDMAVIDRWRSSIDCMRGHGCVIGAF